MPDTPPLGPAPGTSPLLEAKVDSLEALFNKDPLKLTLQDRVRTVEYFRKARETFLRDDAVKVTKAKTGGTPKQAMKPTLSLADLDLDL